MSELVPFAAITAYPHPRTATLPGMAQGVYITLHPDALDAVAQKMAGWFEGWGEVRIVDVGTSDKVGLGFVLLEWIECEGDRFFLVMLRDEPTVADYTVFGRTL